MKRTRRDHSHCFFRACASGWKPRSQVTGRNSLLVPPLCLLKVDDVPDGAEVLHGRNVCHHGATFTISRWGTHLGLDVEILKVKRMFPNVDADDGNVRQERILVGRRHDLEDLALGVEALHRSHVKQS